MKSRLERRRHRTKLLVTILTTYGFTLMAGSLIDPVVKHTPVRWWHIAGALMALAMQAVAMYLAPEGEKDD